MEEQLFLDFDLRFNLRQAKQNKPTIIYAVFTYGGKQVKINTKVKVYPKQWNRKRQSATISNNQTRLDNSNNKIVNDTIKEIEIAFQEQKYYLCDNTEKIENIINLFKQSINPQYKSNMKKKTEPLATYIMTNYVQTTKSDTAAGQYITIISAFKSFLDTKGIDNHLASMNFHTLKAYQDYMCDEDPKRVTTINNKIGMIKHFLKQISKTKQYDYKYSDSELDDLESIPDIRSKWDKRSKQVSLTEEQIYTLYNLSNLTAEEEEYKDLFILQCWTGQRVSDLLKLFDRTYYLDENTISYKNKKTREDVSVKLDTYGYQIKDILQKYANNQFHYIDLNLLGEALDALDDNEEELKNKFKRMCERYNKAIKSIGKKAGFNTPTEYIEQFGRKLVPSKDVFWRMMHSHSARHSYITNMLRRGVSKDTIRITTGHADDEMIDLVYQHLTKEDIANKLHQGMNISTNKTEPTKSLNKNKFEVINFFNKNDKKEKYINNIDEAKEVLVFLGVDASEFIDIYDFTELLVMIGRREEIMMKKFGLENTKKFKEIFNEKSTMKKRIELLHELYIILKEEQY